MDVGTVHDARKRDREWRERYRSASPEEKREMRRSRSHEKEIWKTMLERMKEPPGRVLVLRTVRSTWFRRLLHRLGVIR